MNIDATTLSDLEVFQDGAGRGGVFALLDHTETEVGRRALRRRLEAPLHDVAAIRSVQAAVEFFRASTDLGLFAGSGSTEAVERYLSSNIEVAAGGVLDQLVLTVRYRDLVSELRDGVSTTETWVRRATGTVRSILAQDPPPLVEQLCVELRDALQDVALSSGSGTLAEALRLDRSFRVDGRERLLRAVAILGELDSLRSMAHATEALGWTVPQVVEADHFVLEGEGLYHPFVEHPVANPISLAGGEPMVFLTGPNMAGKTTYLRAAALAVLLAQVGMSVPATSLRLTPVEVLLSSLSPSDNLRVGLSFFQAEVLRVREAATHLAEGRRAFVLFDEVFKGTNVKDALEASATVILGFARARGSGFIFSSHLVELVGVLRAEPRVKFHYFDGAIEQGRAAYSYRMRDGVSDQRFGLHLLGEAQIPDLLARIGG